MTLILELPPSIEANLQAEAARRGVALEVVAMERLETPTKPMSGAEAIAYWKQNDVFGLFSNRPEDSPELARKFREQAQTRTHE